MFSQRCMHFLWRTEKKLDKKNTEKFDRSRIRWMQIWTLCITPRTSLRSCKNQYLRAFLQITTYRTKVSSIMDACILFKNVATLSVTLTSRCRQILLFWCHQWSRSCGQCRTWLAHRQNSLSSLQYFRFRAPRVRAADRGRCCRMPPNTRPLRRLCRHESPLEV